MYEYNRFSLFIHLLIGCFHILAIIKNLSAMNTGMHTSLKISVLQGAQGWCTGMTQGDGMGREVGGGFRMGNTCILMVDSSQCMAKPIQYCKV